MKHGHLIVEKKEYVIVKRLLNLSRYYKDGTLKKYFEKLIRQLDVAQIVNDDEMPTDIVRLNSIVQTKSNDGQIRKFQIVLPNDSNDTDNKISILTPIGLASIGYSEGDEIAFSDTGFTHKLQIEKVYQEMKPIHLDMLL